MHQRTAWSIYSRRLLLVDIRTRPISTLMVNFHPTPSKLCTKKAYRADTGSLPSTIAILDQKSIDASRASLHVSIENFIPGFSRLYVDTRFRILRVPSPRDSRYKKIKFISKPNSNSNLTINRYKTQRDPKIIIHTDDDICVERTLKKKSFSEIKLHLRKNSFSSSNFSSLF